MIKSIWTALFSAGGRDVTVYECYQESPGDDIVGAMLAGHSFGPVCEKSRSDSQLVGCSSQARREEERRLLGAIISKAYSKMKEAAYAVPHCDWVATMPFAAVTRAGEERLLHHRRRRRLPPRRYRTKRCSVAAPSRVLAPSSKLLFTASELSLSFTSYSKNMPTKCEPVSILVCHSCLSHPRTRAN